MQGVGISLPDETVEELDEMTAEWDDRESRTIKRSEVAREALAVGLVALEELDDENPAMTTRQRKAIVRQSVLDHFEPDE